MELWRIMFDLTCTAWMCFCNSSDIFLSRFIIFLLILAVYVHVSNIFEDLSVNHAVNLCV